VNCKGDILAKKKVVTKKVTPKIAPSKEVEVSPPIDKGPSDPRVRKALGLDA